MSPVAYYANPYNDATSSGTTSGTYRVWTYWTTTTATSTTNVVQPQWYEWQNAGTASYKIAVCGRGVYDLPAQETAEQRAERLERQAAERAKWAREARRHKIRAEVAAIRARRLLDEILTADQAEQYERDRYFELAVHDSRTGSVRRFRVSHGRSGNVAEIDESGHVRRRACIHPYGVNEPTEDTLAAQKLLLETNLEEFERVANWS